MDKKKRNLLIIGLVLIGVVIVALVVVFSKGDEKGESSGGDDKLEQVSATPLLYEVTKSGSDTKVYLFGSIHLADDRAYPMPSAVMKAYEDSDYLAVEFDVVDFEKDVELQVEMLQYLVAPDGLLLEDMLREDTYEMLVTYLKENKMYSYWYLYYRPAMLYSLVSNVQSVNSGLDADKGIDMYFLNEAKDDGKEILEVESALGQYEMLGGFPEVLFDLLIKYSIMYEEDVIDGTKELYEAWLDGDVQRLGELLEEDVDMDVMAEFSDYEYEELLSEYNEELIYRRNDEMTEVVEEYFEDERDVFVVVGMGHIIGETGLVNALSEEGYGVSKVEY